MRLETVVDHPRHAIAANGGHILGKYDEGDPPRAAIRKCFLQKKFGQFLAEPAPAVCGVDDKVAEPVLAPSGRETIQFAIAEGMLMIW